MELCSRERCTACGACINACPKKCIEFKKDEYGFLFPIIDKVQCIQCGKCVSACHILNKPDLLYPNEAYAAWSSDSDDRKSSTSGGAASVFYQTVVGNGGIGYGAVYDDNLNVVIRGYDNGDIVKYKNSKYVYSSLGNVFSEIKKNILERKMVLFIGLPCQTAAIKTYLGKEYGNLILVDIVCHGTPPQQYLNEHISAIEKKYGKKASHIKFRKDNDFEFMCFDSCFDKPFFSRTKNADAYLLSFFEALTYRESCYCCTYAQNKRVGDITIGDFWGLGLKKPFNHPYTGAISLVLINSSKGKKFFEMTKSKMFTEERDVSEGLEGNAQLNTPSIKNENREHFLSFYAANGFEYAIEKIYGEYMKKQNVVYKRQQRKLAFRKTIKKILRK